MYGFPLKKKKKGSVSYEFEKRANIQDESTHKINRAHFRFVNRIHNDSGKKLIYTVLPV